MSKKQKIALHITLIVILMIPMFFLFRGWINLNNSTSPQYTYKTVTESQPRVYVTRTGDHYHSSSCQYLHSSKIAKGRQQAIDEGYYACSACGGKSSGTITVTYKKKVEKSIDSPGTVVGCIALSALTTPLLYAFLAWGVNTIIEKYRERNS